MFILKLLSYLPLGVLYLWSYFVYFLAFYIIGYRKKVVLENLSLVFPHKSVKELKVIRKKFYKHLSQVVVEILKSLSISVKDIEKRVTIKNEHLILEAAKKNQSFFAMTGHHGNWEWIFSYVSQRWNFPTDTVYKKLSNTKFDKLMLQSRSKFGGKPIEMREVVREILKRKNEFRGYGLVADQSPAKNEVDQFYTFFGIETPFYSGTEKLAGSLKFPVYFIQMKKIKRGYYEIVFHFLSEMAEKEGKSITQKYVEFLEEEITEQPEIWLWSHRRFKHAKLNK